MASMYSITCQYKVLFVFTAAAPKPQPSVSTGSSDDCVIVDEIIPEDELVKKAESMKLPRTFYNYLRAPQCPGCIGCDPDAFDFSAIGSKKKDADKEDGGRYSISLVKVTPKSFNSC